MINIENMCWCFLMFFVHELFIPHPKDPRGRVITFPWSRGNMVRSNMRTSRSGGEGCGWFERGMVRCHVVHFVGEAGHQSGAGFNHWLTVVFFKCWWSQIRMMSLYRKYKRCIYFIFLSADKCSELCLLVVQGFLGPRKLFWSNLFCGCSVN